MTCCCQVRPWGTGRPPRPAGRSVASGQQRPRGGDPAGSAEPLSPGAFPLCAVAVRGLSYSLSWKPGDADAAGPALFPGLGSCEVARCRSRVARARRVPRGRAPRLSLLGVRGGRRAGGDGPRGAVGPKPRVLGLLRGRSTVRREPVTPMSSCRPCRRLSVHGRRGLGSPPCAGVPDSVCDAGHSLSPRRHQGKGDSFLTGSLKGWFPQSSSGS